MMEERISFREVHVVRYRELRVRYTRHWENKIVTQPLEKLLVVSHKSEESARSKCTLGNSSFQSVWLLGVGNDVEALEQHGAGGGGQDC